MGKLFKTSREALTEKIEESLSTGITLQPDDCKVLRDMISCLIGIPDYQINAIANFAKTDRECDICGSTISGEDKPEARFKDLPMSDIIHDPPTNSNPSFEQIHARGTQEFGLAWLKTNEDIVGSCHTLGFNVNTPLHKKVISLVVLRSMYRGRQALKDRQAIRRRPRTIDIPIKSPPPSEMTDPEFEAFIQEARDIISNARGRYLRQIEAATPTPQAMARLFASVLDEEEAEEVEPFEFGWDA